MPAKSSKTVKPSRIVRMTAEEARAHSRSRKLYPGERTSAELAALRDDEIDYSDIPPLDEHFFRLAELLTPGRKRSLTVRLDEEIYQWLKRRGPRYQTRLNAMLKAMMILEEKPARRKPRKS